MRKRTAKRNPALYADPYQQALADNFSKVQQSRMFSEITLAAHQGYDKSKIARQLANAYRLNDRFAYWMVEHAVRKPLSNPIKKSPLVPKILQSVPQNLSDMTDAQWDASVKWYSKLPLKEIRKRQGITTGQKEDLYRRTRAIGREMNTQESMGWNNLDVMESILTEAAMRKLPRYKGK